MARKHRPRHGSMAFRPRKRSGSEVPHFTSWPEVADGSPRAQAFAGYKAGMTHVTVVDYRPTSTTSGQEVQVPVTVLEVPPMAVAAVRVYRMTMSGLQTLGEVWAADLDPALARRRPLPKASDPDTAWEALAADEAEDVRLLTHTRPGLVTGLPKKAPELMETRVGGGTIADRLAYAREVLGKELAIRDFAAEGAMVDVAAVTKGKGFQGHVKRFGVKLLSHKDSKHRRKVGTTGSFKPGITRPQVPQAGQMGYHQRTEYNKRILKIGENGEEITPNGGFLHYGVVRNAYVLLHGTVPGPVKRLVRLRDPARPRYVELTEPPEITYVSLASKQGA